MSHIHVDTERTIDAKPEIVYDTLVDYRWKRPRILTANFVDYNVGKGGQGAGTEIHYRLHAARRVRSYAMQVEEPRKGQVITERDRNSSLVTTWTLTPIDNGEHTIVQVVSEWEGGTGVGGFFERTFAPLGLSKIYSEILSNLAALLQAPQTALQERPAARLNLPVLIGGAVVVVGVATVLVLRNQQK